MTNEKEKTSIGSWFMVAVLVYLLLLSVSLIGGGFKSSAGENARELFAFASNPFAGLLVGVIATALIQSSSTVTSIIVGLVAGGLPVDIAIAMVMGANIGTTVTNTIVSTGHMRDGKEFKRAYAAATIHDFFNILCVIIFLPLEIMFGLLDKIGLFFANLMIGGDSLSIKGFNFIKPIVKPVTGLISDMLSFLPKFGAGIAMIIIGVTTILVSITLIGKLLKILMVGKAKNILHNSVGKNPISGIFSGTILTVLVQSSSTTTSLIVPLAGKGIFKLKQIYPFTLGANIGTCITALLAATAITDGNALFALQIALIHLIYNLLGVIVVYGTPFLRNLPIKAAETLSDYAAKSVLYVIGYVLAVFIIIPLTFIMLF